ncbi:MAG: hypothetical protein MZV65_39390 [Chromatiales bacterium]|nr:hypothetical protein [Chromatiales bacterium]
MATVTVEELLLRAQTILQDATALRWPLHELLAWLNDAYREIVLLRPDANSETGVYTCSEGTRQDLAKANGGFPNALSLLDVVRNVAASSSKRAIRHIDRTILDDQRRGWHAETPTVNVEHFMFDARLPRSFLVYPPATAQAQLEVVFSSVPLAHSVADAADSSTAMIRIVDSYANAMLDYILYRAYTKDAEYAANAQRATAHYQALATALGIKTRQTSRSPRKNPVSRRTRNEVTHVRSQ